MPDRTPVAALKLTPVGSAPDSLRAGAGKPDALTVNDPACPTVNVWALALVNAGFSSTISVKLCVVVLNEFVAVKVIE